MRSYFPFIPLLVAVALDWGCGAPAPSQHPEPSASATPLAGRVRLTNSLAGSYDGLRFTDAAIITTRLLWAGDVATPEVRGSDGSVLTGAAQRTDLEFRVGRYTSLSAPGNAVCFLPGPFAAIADVDGTACTKWSHQQLLGVTGSFTTDFVGTGLVVRTESGAFRLWIAASGWDEIQKNNFVLFDYVADPRLMVPAATAGGPGQCATENQACQVRDDCCNSRHSCTTGVCAY